VATLTVRHLVPFGLGPWGNRFVNFHQWLPDGEPQAIVRKAAEHTTRLWFDRSCAVDIGADEELSQMINVRVRKVVVDVELEHVSDNLARFVYDEREAPRLVHYGVNPDQEAYDDLRKEYLALGVTVFEAALTAYNRFVSFARNEKGQYWLPERAIDHGYISSLNNECNAQVRSEGYGWVRWCPLHPHQGIIYIHDSEIYIREDEWGKVQEFVAGNSRSNLVFELLANAELLIDEGYRRSAIVDAVAALEQAVTAFSESPRVDALIPEHQLIRIDIRSLKSQVQHLGFSGTVRYLLPLLFREEILPTPLLNTCQDAIEVRNTIAHRGRRDVSEEKIRPLVASLRRACTILAQYTR
jgi:hypothetical protein